MAKYFYFDHLLALIHSKVLQYCNWQSIEYYTGHRGFFGIADDMYYCMALESVLRAAHQYQLCYNTMPYPLPSPLHFFFFSHKINSLFPIKTVEFSSIYSILYVCIVNMRLLLVHHFFSPFFDRLV